MNPPLARPLLRGERETLPNRRGHETYSLRLAGHKIKVQIGTRTDGTVCEVFVRLYREGAPFRAMMNSRARAISAALQYGIPLAGIIADLREESFDPRGTVRGHPSIRSAGSFLDLIGQVLELYPGGRPATQPAAELAPLSPAAVVALATGGSATPSRRAASEVRA